MSKFFPQKLSNLGPMLNKLLQLKRIIEGVWGQKSQPLDDFCDFAGKNSDFQRHFNHFLRVLETI